MNPRLLEYLVCPECQIGLRCKPVVEEANEIVEGVLRCPQCEADYPILDSIPRFVTGEHGLHGRNVETADAFGWQWRKFNQVRDQAIFKDQFLDWIAPLDAAFLAGKVVLDAGCGMGRFSLVSSEFRAKTVLAVDASDAVESAQENARGYPNVHVIQADIHRLPLRRGSDAQIDFAFSIGVLHHLDDPQAGFSALVRHVEPQGTVFAWVYGRENNGWVVHVVNPLRTILTSRLPRRALYLLAGLVAGGLYPILNLVYRPANEPGKRSWLRKVLPYYDYLAWLGQFPVAYTHNVVFDHLVAPVAFYLRKEEFESWFREAGLEIVNLSWRNRNSWRGHGRFAE